MLTNAAGSRSEIFFMRLLGLESHVDDGALDELVVARLGSLRPCLPQVCDDGDTCLGVGAEGWVLGQTPSADRGDLVQRLADRITELENERNSQYGGVLDPKQLVESERLSFEATDADDAKLSFEKSVSAKPMTKPKRYKRILPRLD